MNKWFSYLKVIERKSTSGEIALKLGAWHLQNNEWGRALQLIEHGITKGNLQNLQDAYGLLAECHRQLGRKTLTETFFEGPFGR